MTHKLKYDERPTWNETHEMAYERALIKKDREPEAPAKSAPRIRLVQRTHAYEPPEPTPLPIHKPQLMRIIELVSEITCVPVQDIVSHRRWQSTAIARKIVYYLARRHTFPRMSYPEIGRALARHHASVLNGERTLARMMSEDEVFRQKVEKASETLGDCSESTRRRILRVAK